jgi:hypothetical protein
VTLWLSYHINESQLLEHAPDSSFVIFRCFNCANEDCPLSGRQQGSDVDIAPCPESGCDSFLRLFHKSSSNNNSNNNSQKSYGLSCCRVGCNKSWWFPRYVKHGMNPLD